MKSKGFTLIELIVVMAIMGILLGIAVVSGKAWMERYQVESQMKELYADLMNARINAMQKQRMYFVVLSGMTGTQITQYTVYEDRDPAHPNDAAVDGDGALQQASDSLVKQKNLGEDYALACPAARIDFNPRGMVPASRLLENGNTQTTIRMTQTHNSVYSCLIISAARTRMGAWDEVNNYCIVR